MVKIRQWSSKPPVCASKGNLQCEFAFSLNQQILSNLNGNLNNDEFSQIKTRVHVLQQTVKKRGVPVF